MEAKPKTAEGLEFGRFLLKASKSIILHQGSDDYLIMGVFNTHKTHSLHVFYISTVNLWFLKPLRYPPSSWLVLGTQSTVSVKSERDICLFMLMFYPPVFLSQTRDAWMA